MLVALWLLSNILIISRLGLSDIVFTSKILNFNIPHNRLFKSLVANYFYDSDDFIFIASIDLLPAIVCVSNICSLSSVSKFLGLYLL